MKKSPDPRYSQLLDWLKQCFPTHPFEVEVASNDASFRRYFRVLTEANSFIVMDAPPEKEALTPFIEIAKLLEQQGIHAPHLFAQDLKQGFLLLSDLGKTPYLSVLTENNADLLYKSAIDSILTMQTIQTALLTLPNYDAPLLLRELTLFDQWFLQRHLELTPPDFLDSLYSLLIDNALQQPQRFVHRDYHSRNIMYLEHASAGIIDFQDAVVGPISYDLVSLLKDAYVQWPADKISHWIEYYCEQAVMRQIFTAQAASQFVRWFDLMGLQRHLKILGIFCRLNYRDGKPQYMQDLKLTLQYVFSVAEKYPELEALQQYLMANANIRAVL